MARYAVREIRCKSVINRVRGMPFEWSINPYRGCRHACVYCYARPTHEYLGMNAAEEFQEVIFAKVNAAHTVRAELSRKGLAGGIRGDWNRNGSIPAGRVPLSHHERDPRGVPRLPQPGQHHHEITHGAS